MDFDDSPEERALRAAGPGVARRACGAASTTLPSTRCAPTGPTPRSRTWHCSRRRRAWQRHKAAAGWAAPHWPRRARRHGPAADARRCVRRRGAALRRVGQHVQRRCRHGRPDDHRVGHRRPARRLPPADPERRAHLVPAVQRARCRLRPGRAVDQGGPRRRRVGGDRPEGVDLGGALRRLGDPAGPHRPRRAQAPWHHLPSSWTMGSPGVDVRPLRQIDGAIHFNEVFLDEVRVPVANTLGPVGGGWGVAHHDARPRAGLDRRRRHVHHGAGRGAGPCHGPTPPIRSCASGWRTCTPASSSCASSGTGCAPPPHAGETARPGELGDEARRVRALRDRRRPGRGAARARPAC